jgi:N-acetylglucosaminyl-diphospho-decaprenol L-rhamnosyltransferase
MLKKDNITVRIIILNYNGRALLEECLPSIMLASRSSKFKCSVCVIDNLSTDDSVSFLRSSYRDIELIESKENIVLCSFNQVLREGTEDLSVLLNNDMKVDAGFVDPLVEVFFKHEDAFLAVPKIMSFDGKTCENGKGRTRMRYGMFWAKSRYPRYEKELDQEGIISHGANGAFLRKGFVDLEGFDSLYLPGIMEEADLCFRAYKQGNSCYYVPGSVIFHKGRASFKKVFAEKKIEALAHRNTFLFMWKNISSPRYLLEHLFFLLPRVIISLFTGKPEFIAGFFQALPRLSLALARRRSISGKNSIKSDEEVMRQFLG